MKREYECKHFEGLLDYLINTVPDIHIATDISEMLQGTSINLQTPMLFVSSTPSKRKSL